MNQINDTPVSQVNQINHINRVPLVLQGEANECALACVCMILNFFGAHESMSHLRAKHSTGQPLSLEQLRQVANSYRLETRALRCDLGDLRQIQRRK